MKKNWLFFLFVICFGFVLGFATRHYLKYCNELKYEKKNPSYIFLKTSNTKQKTRLIDDVTHNGYIPEEGFVPNSLAAYNIGMSVLVPIYGVDVVEREKPYQISLPDGKNWHIKGTGKRNVKGGVAVMLIEKKTGKIMYVGHGE